MNININTDLITIIGLVFGFVSTGIAIYQYRKTKGAKRIYESHCIGKCKSIVSLTKTLSNEVTSACNILYFELKHSDLSSNPNVHILSGKINAINVLTARLVSFCEEINDDHESQFGYKVFPNLDDVLICRECLNEAKEKLESSCIEKEN